MTVPIQFHYVFLSVVILAALLASSVSLTGRKARFSLPPKAAPMAVEQRSKPAAPGPVLAPVPASLPDPAFAMQGSRASLVPMEADRLGLSIGERDRRVATDLLYPPLGRGDMSEAVMKLNSRYMFDTFRPVAYMASQANPKDILVLYGRAMDQRGRKGEFYVTTTDATSTFKYMLTDKNSNVRNLDDLPQRITITGPLVAGNYDVVELPRNNLGSGYV